MNNADEAFDLSVTLRKRLDEINNKKDGTQVKINIAVEQLQKMLDKGKKKYRDTPAQLEAKIKDLERRRTTTSLPLAEEKDILRQIGLIEKTLVQIEENKDHECLIQEKKAEVTNLRTSLRNIIAQIAELEGALSKVELAKRLGCATKDLTTYILDCPGNKLGQVIGKNGSNIKQLENQTGCMIDVDKVKSQVHLHGSDTAIERAVEELENITLSIEESVPISEAVHTHLFGKRMAAFIKLQTLYPKIFFDLNREKTTINLRGKPEAVSIAKESILGIRVEMETMKLAGRESGLVVGKGGTTVNKLSDDYNVAIDISKVNEESSAVKIVGTTENVACAKAAIQELIFKNEEVEVPIIVDSLTRNMLLSDSGSLMKQLQKEVKEKCDHGSTMMNFEKLSKEEVKSNSTSILSIKASRIGIEEAVTVVKSRIDSYVADTLTMKVDVDIVPLIIGKGGETINKLKSMGAGAEIHVEKSTGEIKVLGGNEAKLAIKNAIDDIVSKNQVINVPVDESMVGLMFGNKELKQELEAKDVFMTNGPSRKFIKLRGQLEMITEAAVLLRDFIAKNYLVEVPYHAEDEEVLAHGDSSFLNELQTKYGVKVTAAKQRRRAMIRGKQEATMKAEEDLKNFLFGGGGISVSKIVIPGNAIGMIIGKGGSNIAKLRSNHDSVSISIGRLSNCICVRGEVGEVKNCRAEIIRSIASAKMTETVKISKEKFGQLTSLGTKTKVLSDIPVQMTLTDSNVKIRGLCDDVNDAKALVEDFVTGVYKRHIVMYPSQFGKINESKQDFERISETTMTKLRFDKNASAIEIIGKRSNVKKAKLLLMGNLESLLPSQFSKIKMPKPLVQTVGKAEELAEIAAESGCMVDLDRDTNSVIVQSSYEDDLLMGLDRINNRIKECGKLLCVIRIESHDSWLLAKFLQGGEIVSKIQSDCNCKVDVWKEELMVCFSGEDEDNVLKAKQQFDTFTAKVKKENVFIDLPEPAVNLFIGKFRGNINQFSETHGVQIDRVKRTASRIRINGNEVSVENAVLAVKAWVKDWEAKNKGNIMSFDDGEISFLLANSKVLIKEVEKTFRVTTEVDRVKSTLVIRGKKKEEASRKIFSLIQKYRILQQDQNAAEIEKESEKKSSSTFVVENALHSDFNEKQEEKLSEPHVDVIDAKDDTYIIPKNIAKKDEKNTLEPQFSAEERTKSKVESSTVASSLFNLLLTDRTSPTELVTSDTQDQWDSSTVSSGESPETGGTYYKSTSGFTVRL